MKKSAEAYNKKAKDFSDKYEALKTEDVHKEILQFIPEKPSRILEVGAGSGRDAAWFAEKGHTVVAAEPSEGMIEEAKKRHKSPNITWVKDAMPELKNTLALKEKFDFINLSAVWMHVKPEDRKEAFSNLSKMLSPNGKMAISLRLGKPDPDREMYPVSVEELQPMAKASGVKVIYENTGGDEDLQKRSDVHWGYMCFEKGKERGEKEKTVFTNREKENIALLTTFRLFRAAKKLSLKHTENKVSGKELEKAEKTMKAFLYKNLVAPHTAKKEGQKEPAMNKAEETSMELVIKETAEIVCPKGVSPEELLNMYKKEEQIDKKTIKKAKDKGSHVGGVPVEVLKGKANKLMR